MADTPPARAILLIFNFLAAFNVFSINISVTDNAAMIASAGYYNYINGKISNLELNAIPNLKIGE